jgi:hypothetical protein
MGTRPLAGHYLSKKAFIEGAFSKLGQVFPKGAQLQVEQLIVRTTGCGRAPLSGCGQEPHAIRRSLSLGRLLPK